MEEQYQKWPEQINYFKYVLHFHVYSMMGT
jgi:hypothetical protein